MLKAHARRSFTQALTGSHHVPLVLRKPLRRHGYYQRRHLHDAHGLTYSRQVQTPIIIYEYNVIY